MIQCKELFLRALQGDGELEQRRQQYVESLYVQVIQSFENWWGMTKPNIKVSFLSMHRREEGGGGLTSRAKDWHAPDMHKQTRVNIMLSHLKSLAADADATVPVPQPMTHTCWPARSWTLTQTKAEEIVSVLESFLNWYTTYVGTDMNSAVPGRIATRQSDIHTHNRVSLADLCAFLFAIEWMRS